MSGWIKIHRTIQNHWIFSDEEKLKAWIIILFTVNFEPKKVNIKNTIFECNRGESLLSLDSWAEKFGKNWNKSKVRRFFKLLESDSMIVVKSEQKTTRLTVCNYETYQDERNASETQVKRKRNASETQTTPTKECKECKECKEEKINKKKNFICPTVEEIKKYCIERKNNIDPTYFHDFYTSKNWLIGKTKMSDWKACVRTWEKNSNKDIMKSKNEEKEHDYSRKDYKTTL